MAHRAPFAKGIPLEEQGGQCRAHRLHGRIVCGILRWCGWDHRWWRERDWLCRCDAWSNDCGFLPYVTSRDARRDEGALELLRMHGLEATASPHTSLQQKRTSAPGSLAFRSGCATQLYRVDAQQLHAHCMCRQMLLPGAGACSVRPAE